MDFVLDLLRTKRARIRIRRDRVAQQMKLLRKQNKEKLNEKKNQLPLFLAREKLSSTLWTFKQERRRLHTSWEIAYENFSWWGKLNNDSKLETKELDEQIESLEWALQSFDRTYVKDISKVNAHFDELHKTSELRLEKIHAALTETIESNSKVKISDTSTQAAWIAGMSIPVSIADDIFSANQVFDSLRSVNGNFEAMSNSEIWWETLWMSPESYAGLISLTKGAYFEQLVANETDGLLHDHFNHPDTDITIDGIEMQIKATDSIVYINSVNEDIPIIATSEVAANTGTIDSGFSNEDITRTTELALGGSVIDAQDTAIDAILTGVGTLGIFATIKGINHAGAEYDNGVDGVEAIFKGAGVAISGTAKGMVDASEMAYNVAMSRPSRFIGRTLLKGLKKLDDKMMEAGSKDRR